MGDHAAKPGAEPGQLTVATALTSKSEVTHVEPLDTPGSSLHMGSSISRKLTVTKDR
jgi:hypothetical protein